MLVRRSSKKKAQPGGCAEVPPKEEDFGGACLARREHQHDFIMHSASMRRNRFLLLRTRDFLRIQLNKTNVTPNAPPAPARSRASAPCAFRCRGAPRRVLCGRARS